VPETRGPWTNYFGNVACEAARYVSITSEEELVAEIADASRHHRTVRAHGAGHSNTPLVATDGTLLDLRPMHGLRAVDNRAMTATFGAATTVAEIGPLLWEQGLSLTNQGDTNAQYLAGAVSTGTHGTGITLGSFSGSVAAARLVTAGGNVLEVDGRDQELLRAARTSVGALGLFTEITLNVVPAFSLCLEFESTDWDDVCQRWDTLVAENRHFTFYWCPDGSNEWVPSAGEFAGRERVIVKTMNPLPADTPSSGVKGHGRFIAPAWQVWPDDYLPDYQEFEYMVPVAVGKEAMTEIRELIRVQHPGETMPVEVRFCGADDAMLSPLAARVSCVISVSGRMGADNSRFFHDCHRVLAAYSGRPHWGKAHCFDHPQISSAYAEFGAFSSVRERLDPDGIFLNEHLRALLVK
jgi:FAD/FMN-containing dehydrogenase